MITKKDELRQIKGKFLSKLNFMLIVKFIKCRYSDLIYYSTDNIWYYRIGGVWNEM